jgi:hypothetical protein
VHSTTVFASPTSSIAFSSFETNVTGYQKFLNAEDSSGIFNELSSANSNDKPFRFFSSSFSPRFVVKVFAFVCLLLVVSLFSVSITLEEEEDDDDGSAMARRGIVRDADARFARLPLAVACACALV